MVNSKFPWPSLNREHYLILWLCSQHKLLLFNCLVSLGILLSITIVYHSVHICRVLPTWLQCPSRLATQQLPLCHTPSSMDSRWHAPEMAATAAQTIRGFLLVDYLACSLHNYTGELRARSTWVSVKSCPLNPIVPLDETSSQFRL